MGRKQEACSCVDVSGSNASAHVKSQSTFNTGSNNVLASSAVQPVKHPFSVGTGFSVTGGFKFGALVSQPLAPTMTLSTSSSAHQPTQPSSATAAAAAAGVGGSVVAGELSAQSAALTAADTEPGISNLHSGVYCTRPVLADGSAPVTASTIAVTSQQFGVFASTSLSNSKHSAAAAAAASTDTAMIAVTSPAAETAGHHVNAAPTSSDVSMTSEGSSKAVSPSASALAATEYDGRKSLEFGSKLFPASFVTSSSAIISTRVLTTSISAPLTVTQPSTLFSFGQAAFAQKSSRPLGVSPASTLQFKAESCTGL